MFSYGLAPGTGVSGGVDGASAYQIAVANGFVGTVQQWLLSLVGPQGPVGSVGPEGPAGPAGPAGPQGVQGVAGPKGDQGERGVAGPIGPQGVQGPAGATGPAGPAGPAGPTGPVGPAGATGPAGPQGVQGERGMRGETGQRGDHFATSSVTPLAISSSGEIGLTVEAGLSYTQGQYVIIAHSASLFMRGHVSSYNSVTGALVVEADYASGSGSYSSWQVNVEAVGSVGASAYEVAVANGFVGPESAWLESLVGPQGPAGLSGNAAYHHTQVTSSTMWEITHNLGFFPSVTTQDEYGYDIVGAISYVDEDTVQVIFASAVAGDAYLS